MMRLEGNRCRGETRGRVGAGEQRQNFLKLMIQVPSTRRLEEIESALSRAAQHHDGAVIATTHPGSLLKAERRDAADALVLTLCYAEHYRTLLAAEPRFAAYLPCRVAAVSTPDGLLLEAISPAEFCRLIGRADLEAVTAPLERALRAVMEEAAAPLAAAAAGHARALSGLGATEMQVNLRATLAPRIDCHGTKIEDLAGTGRVDAPGG